MCLLSEREAAKKTLPLEAQPSEAPTLLANVRKVSTSHNAASFLDLEMQFSRRNALHIQLKMCTHMTRMPEAFKSVPG